jgi:hypothetical protein
METVLNGIVASSYSDVIKRALFDKVVSSSVGLQNNGQVESLLKLAFQWILLKVYYYYACIYITF